MIFEKQALYDSNFVVVYINNPSYTTAFQDKNNKNKSYSKLVSIVGIGSESRAQNWTQA